MKTSLSNPMVTFQSLLPGLLVTLTALATLSLNLCSMILGYHFIVIFSLPAWNTPSQTLPDYSLALHRSHHSFLPLLLSNKNLLLFGYSPFSLWQHISQGLSAVLWDESWSVQTTGPQCVVPGPGALPENSIKIQILTFHSRPTQQKSLGVEPSNLCFNKLSSWSQCMSNLGTIGSSQSPCFPSQWLN